MIDLICALIIDMDLYYTFQDLLKDIEVQRSSVVSLRRDLPQLSEHVSANVFSKMEATVSRSENRFQLVAVFFTPCDNDGKFQGIFGEYVTQALSKVDDLAMNCNDFMDRRKNKFPSEKDIENEIRETTVCVKYPEVKPVVITPENVGV